MGECGVPPTRNSDITCCGSHSYISSLMPFCCCTGSLQLRKELFGKYWRRQDVAGMFERSHQPIGVGERRAGLVDAIDNLHERRHSKAEYFRILP